MSAAKRRHSCVTVRSCSRMMRSMRSAGVARMSQNENIPALLITTSTTIPSAVMRSYNSCAAPTRARSIAITRTSGVTAAVALLPHSFPLPTPCCALPAASALFPSVSARVPRSFGNRRRRFASRRPASVCGCCNSQSFRNFRFFGNFRSFRGFRLFRGCFSPGRPGIPYLFRHGFERCAVVARDHQPVAQRCQPQGVAAPDARPGARHQRPCAAWRHCAAFLPAVLRLGRAVLRTRRGAGVVTALSPRSLCPVSAA